MHHRRDLFAIETFRSRIASMISKSRLSGGASGDSFEVSSAVNEILSLAEKRPLPKKLEDAILKLVGRQEDFSEVEAITLRRLDAGRLAEEFCNIRRVGDVEEARLALRVLAHATTLTSAPKTQTGRMRLLTLAESLDPGLTELASLSTLALNAFLDAEYPQPEDLDILFEFLSLLGNRAAYSARPGEIGIFLANVRKAAALGRPASSAGLTELSVTLPQLIASWPGETARAVEALARLDFSAIRPFFSPQTLRALLAGLERALEEPAVLAILALLAEFACAGEDCTNTFFALGGEIFAEKSSILLRDGSQYARSRIAAILERSLEAGDRHWASFLSGPEIAGLALKLAVESPVSPIGQFPAACFGFLTLLTVKGGEFVFGPSDLSALAELGTILAEEGDSIGLALLSEIVDKRMGEFRTIPPQLDNSKFCAKLNGLLQSRDTEVANEAENLIELLRDF